MVFLCAAVAAYGSSYQQPAIWIFWLPAVVSVFWRLERAPSGEKWARYASWTLLAVAVALGLVLMAYSALISEQTAKWMTLVTGYGLAAFASVFLLGTPVWSPAQGFLPAATGLLVVASFNSTAKITPLLLAPGAAMFVYLLLTKDESGRPWRLITTRLLITSAASLLVGWALYAGLPQLQKQVESATLQWFASQTGAGTPTAMQSRVGELEELKLSKRVVMRVWTNEPQKLRGRVYGRFDGRTWQARITPAEPLAHAADTAKQWLDDVPGNTFVFAATKLPAQGAVVTRIFQTVIAPGVLVSPGNKVLVRAPLPNLSADASEGLSPPLTAAVQIYGIVSKRNIEKDEAAQPEQEYLALPAVLDPRWTELAEKLKSGTKSDEERVERTTDYVKHAATYSLQVGKFQTRDPVTEFLFEKKKGYCQYFASAAVLLLRLQGVPARYVTGYTVQEFNQPGGHYVVRDADVHAWVEVFTPRGWVEADPTPEAEFAARRQAGETGWLAQAVEWMAAAASEVWVRVRQGDWRGAVASLRQGIKALVRVMGSAAWGIVLLALLMAAAWLWRKRAWPRWRRQQVARTSAAAPLKEFLDVLKRCWDAAGYPRPASRGLLEHAEAMPAAEFRDLSRRYVNAYYRASFGNATGEVRELEELSGRLAEAGARARKHG